MGGLRRRDLRYDDLRLVGDDHNDYDFDHINNDLDYIHHDTALQLNQHESVKYR